MHFLALDPAPVSHLPIETQHQMLSRDLECIDRELPLTEVLDVRRDGLVRTGSPYTNAFDLMMWNVVGNPYETLGPRLVRPYPGVGDVQYGYSFFSGISPTDEILYVGGDLGSSHLGQPSGYTVHTLDLHRGEHKEWFVREVDTGPPTGVMDIELVIGKSALTLVRDEPEPENNDPVVRFRSPSRSDAQIIEGERKTYYNRGLLKNLYSVVHAFDAKYRHLEILYTQPSHISSVEVPAAMIGE